MESKSKVLTGLMERRGLEADYRSLASLSDPEEQGLLADRIAQQGRLALTVLISLLDTEDPELRAGLGRVAMLLPRAETVSELGAAARTGTRSAQITALIILERYLGETPDNHVISSLGAPEDMALQSLRELVAAADADPLAILEYCAQLAQQPPEVPGIILGAIPMAEPSAHLVTLLRLFAQDPDEEFAREALDQLSRARSAAAGRALRSLAATLPPPLAVYAERCSRKAMMSGGSQRGPDACPPWDASDLRWRVLLSALNGHGVQVAVFMGSAAGAESAVSFTVLIDDMRGIYAAHGALDIPTAQLPPASPVGTVHRLGVGDEGERLWFVDTTPRTGRQALREALAVNWAQATPLPLEYRLFNSLIWLAAEEDQDGEPPRTDTMPVSSDMPGVAALLDHPVFADWSWPLGDAYRAQAHTLAAPNHSAGNGSQRGELITCVAQTEFGIQAKERYAKRLRTMSGWLSLAGDQEAAAAAQSAAIELQDSPAEDSLFARWLIGRGIDASSDQPTGERKPASLERQSDA